MDVPSLGELVAEAMEMRSGLAADDPMPAIAHYVAADQVIVVPVTDICEQSGRHTTEVITQVLPQIRDRYGPAQTIVIVADSLEPGVLLVLYADTRTVTAAVTPYWPTTAGGIHWGATNTEVVDPYSTDRYGFGAAIAACFHEVGKFN